MNDNYSEMIFKLKVHRSAIKAMGKMTITIIMLSKYYKKISDKYLIYKQIVNSDPGTYFSIMGFAIESLS